jgi:hypothetical protein
MNTSFASGTTRIATTFFLLVSAGCLDTPGDQTDDVIQASGGGGGQLPPQVVGTWHGHRDFDPSLATVIPPAQMHPAAVLVVDSEDANGTLYAYDHTAPVQVSFAIGTASSNGTIIVGNGGGGNVVDTMTITATIGCANGSTARVMTGKFRQREGFGTITLSQCAL